MKLENAAAERLPARAPGWARVGGESAAWAGDNSSAVLKGFFQTIPSFSKEF